MIFELKFFKSLSSGRKILFSQVQENDGDFQET